VIPVLNKIDLPGAEPDRVKEQIENIIGIDTEHTISASAKEGIGIEEILEAIVTLVPPPDGSYEAPAKALIFDSWYDPYRGVVMLARVVDGTFTKGMRIRLMITGGTYDIEDMGVFSPKAVARDTLSVG
jgi:GTP-binding protein LepA